MYCNMLIASVYKQGNLAASAESQTMSASLAEAYEWSNNNSWLAAADRHPSCMRARA
jgi:hypothetical protein